MLNVEIGTIIIIIIIIIIVGWKTGSIIFFVEFWARVVAWYQGNTKGGRTSHAKAGYWMWVEFWARVVAWYQGNTKGGRTSHAKAGYWMW
jgi:hypothetical protein